MDVSTKHTPYTTPSWDSAWKRERKEEEKSVQAAYMTCCPWTPRQPQDTLFRVENTVQAIFAKKKKKKKKANGLSK